MNLISDFHSRVSRASKDTQVTQEWKYIFFIHLFLQIYTFPYIYYTFISLCNVFVFLHFIGRKRTPGTRWGNRKAWSRGKPSCRYITTVHWYRFLYSCSIDFRKWECKFVKYLIRSVYISGWSWPSRSTRTTWISRTYGMYLIYFNLYLTL